MWGQGHGVLGHHLQAVLVPHPVVTARAEGRLAEGAWGPGTELCCLRLMPLNLGFCFCSGTLEHEVQGVP